MSLFIPHWDQLYNFSHKRVQRERKKIGINIQLLIKNIYRVGLNVNKIFNEVKISKIKYRQMEYFGMDFIFFFRFSQKLNQTQKIQYIYNIQKESIALTVSAFLAAYQNHHHRAATAAAQPQPSCLLSQSAASKIPPHPNVPERRRKRSH